MKHSNHLQQIVEAARQRRPLRITYDGEDRTIEVHTIGLSKRGSTPALRAYQRDGRSGWKLLHVDKVTACEALAAPEVGLRPESRATDAQMEKVLWSLAES